MVSGSQTLSASAVFPGLGLSFSGRLLPSVPYRALGTVPTAIRLVLQVIRSQRLFHVGPLTPLITWIAGGTVAIRVRRLQVFVRYAGDRIMELVIPPIIVIVQLLDLHFRVAHFVLHVLGALALFLADHDFFSNA